MTDTFTPPFAPSYGLSRQITPRVLGAQFGDGYTQRAGDGLNAIPRTATLEWKDLRVVDADTIETFLIAQKGYLAFYWTDPREGSPRKWKCPTWSRASPYGVVDSISATFEQVFDL